MDAHDLLLATMHTMAEEGRKALTHVLAAGATADADRGVPPPENDPAEAIHDLRVALRRLRSVLRSMRLVYGKRPLGAAEARLRAILDLTSELRDEEVLRDTLGDLDLADEVRKPLGRWMQGRARRERGLRNRATRALSGNDERVLEIGVGVCLDELEAKVVEGPKRKCALETFQRAALATALDDLSDRVEASRIEDPESMHRVRIGAKRIRYLAELLGGLVAEAGSIQFLAGAIVDPNLQRATLSDLRRLERASTRIQKRLGHLHDLDEALRRMGRAWGLDTEPRNMLLAALTRVRKSAAQKATFELREELTKIRTASARLLAASTGPEKISNTRPTSDQDEDAAS